MAKKTQRIISREIVLVKENINTDLMLFKFQEYIL